ncbi:hypothetical protein [Paracoccus marinaquae]|uniref:hypothetical protein n=1 Tax=Paracoccus marinaquae TaxID=2841926 RepID=UPI001C0962D1|nr:hypothetical protein [Paracoccus marinaquae]
MPRIPFIEARFFDPDETRCHIEQRLLAHRRCWKSLCGEGFTLWIDGVKRLV